MLTLGAGFVMRGSSQKLYGSSMAGAPLHVRAAPSRSRAAARGRLVATASSNGTIKVGINGETSCTHCVEREALLSGSTAKSTQRSASLAEVPGWAGRLQSR